MKLAIIIVILSFLIGGAYIGHANYVLEKSHIPIDEEKYIYYHIQTEYIKFMIFLPVAIFYFMIAIVIFCIPHNPLPYVIFIGFTGAFLAITAINMFLGNPYPQLNMTTKYGHYIDFPLVKTFQTISMIVTLYVYYKKFCSKVV
jgi:hypothetical protein